MPVDTGAECNRGCVLHSPAGSERTMFTIALILASVVAVIALGKKRGLRSQHREVSVAFKLAQHTFEFSTILVAVLAFYHLLLLAGSVNTDWAQAKFLLSIEHRLAWLQMMLDKYKL